MKLDSVDFLFHRVFPCILIVFEFLATYDRKQAVRAKLRSQLQILLYDSARAHTCRDSQAFMEGYFKPLQIP